MTDAEKIIEVAKALGTKLQQKFENDPDAYVFPDIIDAFMKVLDVTKFGLIKSYDDETHEPKSGK